ncbi:MAG: DUF6152 family protein [Minwuia sp.]|uniref:DUF6152 family protein n=1 Tax=Minwuia sp. TaxID=2493630 RepID=UPI003A8891AD
MKNVIAAIALAVTALFATGAALAHHGWAWTTGGNIEVFGVITKAELGNPHGVLTLDVEGETWTAEVGQPWRNERAGLKDSDFAVGNEIKLIGEPAANIEDKLIKVERLYIGEKLYELYPERD